MPFIAGFFSSRSGYEEVERAGFCDSCAFRFVRTWAEPAHTIRTPRAPPPQPSRVDASLAARPRADPSSNAADARAPHNNRTTAPPLARRNSPELQILNCKFERFLGKRRIGLVGYDAPFTRVRSPVRFWHSVVPFLLVLSLQRRPTLQVPRCNPFITTWLVSNLPSKQSG